jgi:sulfide:quinone oxidoreductase
MRRILILGAGAAGTMAANLLRRELPEDQWRITVIDRDNSHHYQAGYLFIPFGVYSAEDVVKPRKDFIPRGVEFVLDEIVRIDPGNRRVEGKSAGYEYDWLIVATGCTIRPDEVEGLPEAWSQSAFDFYTLSGALELKKQLRYFSKGKVVLNIAEFPFKCPVAPLEFLFMADWFFTVNGVRERVEIEFVTPIGGIFTKPVASKALSEIAVQKNIKVTNNFALASVDAKERTLHSYDGRTVDYDLLVSIPPNMGDRAVIDSGLGDPLGYINTDKHLLRAQGLDRVYVIGDATNVPTSKAGSVAHYQSHLLVQNLVREIDGHEPRAKYDGHTTCFIASGFDKAILLDFNYDVEPLPGKFPFPGLGPFTLLQETLGNHWGKMMFRWVYWNMMMKGLELPLEPQMNMAGKMRQPVPMSQGG